MEAPETMTGWAGENPLPYIPPASVAWPQERAVPDRFEAEAMPHMSDLYRTALRMTGERRQAEDVVQEVYLQAWRSFDRFEPGTNCRAWLYKILFHCVSHHRRKWFRFPLLKETEEFLETNLAQPAPVAEHLTDDEILRALDEIPGDFRSVVLLVDVEEFAYKEVAEILSIPIGTVMSRLSRGRGLLRKRLADVAQSYGIGKTHPKGITMTHTEFSGPACRDAMARLDWYMDNELAAETNLELAEHFEHCGACTREVEARRRMRARLKIAVREVGPPAGLEERVREQLRKSPRPQTRFHLMAIAAAIAICFGMGLAYRQGTPGSTAMQPAAYIAALTARVPEILKAGLQDHLHCAIIRQKITKPENVDHLPPRYREFLPVVRRQVPANLKLAVAHECEYQGRKFIHLTFHDAQNLLSVIVARKQVGDLHDLPPVVDQAGVPVYTGRSAQFHIAAFQTPGFLVFTISDLSRETNIDVLTAIASPLHELLQRMEA